MDCEKFDRVALDFLYGELDELTDAAARRHLEHCGRCKGVSSSLRATKEVGALLPLVDPPEGLELGILEAERRINARLPLRQKLGRGVSILAVYAMRPQLAMAALLLLMIGSSLFFLRARPGARDSVLVTERGIPETESEHVAILPAPERRAAEAAPLAAPKAPAAKGDEAGRARSEERTEPSEALAARDGAEAADKDTLSEGLVPAAPEADSLEAANAAVALAKGN